MPFGKYTLERSNDLLCQWQGSNWDGGGPVWHTGTSLAAWKAYQHFFSEKKILVCFAGRFLKFRQLVADVCVNQ